MVDTSHYNKLIPVSDKKEVYKIEGTGDFCSSFPNNRNIGKKELLALLDGLALIDISDGEYFHWIQLDHEAIDYVKTISKTSLL